MSGVAYDKKKHAEAERALKALYVAFGANRERAFDIELDGRVVSINKRTLAAFDRVLSERQRKALVRGKKGAKRSEEDIAAAVESVYGRIQHALTRSFGSTKAFQSAVLGRVKPMLRAQPKLSSRSFAPTTLSFLDDHFVNFFRSVDELDLLRPQFAGESPAVRSELAKVNAGILDFLVNERVCASTVLQALMSRYVAPLRQNDDRVKAQVIRLSPPLRALLQSHMDSTYNGESLAQYYHANDKQSKRDDERFGLAPYREAHPNRSVEDFILEKAQGSADEATVRALLRDGLIPSQTMLILINAHLIGRTVMVDSGMNEGEVDAIIKSQGDPEQNETINRLLVIQTLVKLSAPRKTAEVGDAPPSAAAARSPPRGSSPMRSRAASVSRSPARSSPAASPGRRASRR